MKKILSGFVLNSCLAFKSTQAARTTALAKTLLAAAALGLVVTACGRVSDAQSESAASAALPPQIDVEGVAPSDVETTDAIQHLREFDRDAVRLARFRSAQVITYEIDPQLPQSDVQLIESNLHYISSAAQKPFNRIVSQAETPDIFYSIGDPANEETAYTEVFNAHHRDQKVKCAYHQLEGAGGEFGVIAVWEDNQPINPDRDRLLKKCLGMATIKTLGLGGAPNTFPSILNAANEELVIRSFTKFDFAAMRLLFAYEVDPGLRISESRHDTGD